MQTYIDLWPNFSRFFLEGEIFQGCRGKQNTHFMSSNIFFNRAVYEIMREYIVELGRSQMTIRCIRNECWIIKALYASSYYVTLAVFHCNICWTQGPQYYIIRTLSFSFNLLKPTGHVMHQQFNIQQLHVLPTLYLCVLYLSENKQRLVPLTA